MTVFLHCFQRSSRYNRWLFLQMPGLLIIWQTWSWWVVSERMVSSAGVLQGGILLVLSAAKILIWLFSCQWWRSGVQGTGWWLSSMKLFHHLEGGQKKKDPKLFIFLSEKHRDDFRISRYLGVHIDNNLYYHYHLGQLINKIKHLVFIRCQSRPKFYCFIYLF